VGDDQQGGGIVEDTPERRTQGLRVKRREAFVEDDEVRTLEGNK